MTLIVGLNMSDKIYLAGDTRVTQYNSNIGRHLFVDNVIKLSPLYGKHVIGPPCNNNLISVAVAGDVGLATHTYRMIKNHIYSGELSSDIRILFEQIDLTYLNKIAESWLSLGYEYGRSCCFIVGGNEHARKKKIDKEKLEILINFYTQEQEDFRNNRGEIEDLIKNDITWQKLNSKLMKDSGKTALQLIDESRVPKVPSHIKQALESPYKEIEGLPDSLVFCVEMKVTQGGVVFDKKKAEWGQYLARGSKGITEGDLSDTLLSMLELMPGKEKNQEHLMEGAMISSTILDIAKERGITTIGGAVIINAIKKDASQIMTKNARSDGQLQIELMGRSVPVVPFFKYMDMLQSNVKAEL